MDTKTFWEDLLHLFVPGALELREERHVTIGQNYSIRTLLEKEAARHKKDTKEINEGSLHPGKLRDEKVPIE